MKNNKGLSLIELIIAFALLAIVGVAASGLLGTGSRLFQSNTKEIDLQTETQSAINHLNNLIVDAQRGIKYDAANNILRIINSDHIYCVKWDGSNKGLYIGKLDITPATTESTEPASYTLLVSNVETFTPDISKVESESKVSVYLKMANDTREYEATQEFALRNNIKTTATLTELINNPIEGATSYVTDVLISDDVRYCAKGKTYMFSARVKGMGYPSQRVTWSVSGATDSDPSNAEAVTVIDSNIGELYIATDEGAPSLDITATSVDKDNSTPPVHISATSKVYVVEVDGILLDYMETSSKIGRILRVNGIPQFDVTPAETSSALYQVEFRLPTQEDVDAYNAAHPTETPKQLKIYDGLDIYQTSSMTNCCDLIFGAEMEDDPDLVFDDATGKAKIEIVAISPIEPEKIFFEEITINKADLTDIGINGDLTVNRGDQTALSAKLEAQGITSGEIRTTWAITKDAGLGDKVSINAETGLLKVSKNIDYNRAFELEVTATAKTKDSLKEIKTTAKVVIPKVTISLPVEAIMINKGSSDRIPIYVNGLKVETGDLICNSKPSMKNTLMYCTVDECVISVGKNETKEMATVNVILKDDTSISKAINVYVLSELEFHNVEGRKTVYAPYYAPDAVGNGKTDKAEDGTALKYTVETVEETKEDKTVYTDITVLTVGSTKYEYDKSMVKDGITGWWIPRSNVEGKEYYIPVPGLASELPNKLEIKYMLNYNGLFLTYTPGTDGKIYVEVTNSDGTKDKFSLSTTTKETWVVAN